jgi:protein gp37
MSDDSKIEWTDATWNPVTGCTEVSPGCDHCYAKTFAERWRGTPGHHFEQGFDLVLRPERLEQPIRWKKPRRIFVNSMSDLFHDEVPDTFILQVFSVMQQADQHTFQLLTKRHGRMRSLMPWIGRKLSEDGETWPLPNVWLGVSVENQQWADIRIPALLATPAEVRFLSCEPLLGPVDIARYIDPERECNCHVPAMDGAGQHSAACRCFIQPEISWVIVGGESGHGARPMHPDWARSLRDQCSAAGVAFHFKQWGEWAPHRLDGGTHVNSRMSRTRDQHQSHRFAPDGTAYVASEPDLYSYPGMASLLRVGKTKAGRELDGRTWDEFPPETPLSSRRRADAGRPSSSTRASETAAGQGTPA